MPGYEYVLGGKRHGYRAASGISREAGFVNFFFVAGKGGGRRSEFKKAWEENFTGEWEVWFERYREKEDEVRRFVDDVCREEEVVVGLGGGDEIKLSKGASHKDLMEGIRKAGKGTRGGIQVCYKDEEGDLIEIDDDLTLTTILQSSTSSLTFSVRSLPNTDCEYPHDGPVYSSKFLHNKSANPTFVTCSRDGSIRRWEINNPNPIQTIPKAHSSGIVLTLDTHPTEGLYATGGDDHIAKIWSASKATPLATLPSHTASVYTVKMSPNDVVSTAGLDGKGVLWDLPTGRERGPLKTRIDQVFSSAFSPCGRFVAYVGKVRGLGVPIFDVSSGKLVATLDGGSIHTGTLWGVSFSRCGTMLCTVSSNSELVTWDLSSRSPLSSARTHRPAHCIAHKGKHLITAGRDAGVTFRSPTPIPSYVYFHSSPERDIIYSLDAADDILLTASSNSVVRTCVYPC